MTLVYLDVQRSIRMCKFQNIYENEKSSFVFIGNDFNLINHFYNEVVSSLFKKKI